ncbi:MAG TPA: HEAT repeat domain-containing protein [Solirubrobacteraceae bacterium]|nr:HEAT repeat domain-containing protein [Solirubrobacteraceae bacterium]
MSVLEIAALALSACSIVMLSVLVTRRWELARRARHRREVEDRLKQVALELLHAGSEPPAGLNGEEKEALADLLGRYAQTVRGPTHDNIVGYFARQGTIDRELAVLAGARAAWRRGTAAFRLGDIGSERAAPALIAALGDSDRAVRVAAARSLGRLRAPEAGTALVAAAADGRAPAGLVQWALLQIGPPALPELRSLLVSPNERERAAALQLIGLLGGPSDAGETEARLRDSSSLVRAQAARALGRLGSDRNLPALMDALEDRIPDVRAAAAISLGYLRDPRALDALTEHAEGDDSFDVARESARAAARIDPVATAAAARASGSDHLREAVDLAGIR